MTEILCPQDFDTTNLDMWSALVSKAIELKIIPEGTKSEDVEEIEVKVVGAFVAK